MTADVIEGLAALAILGWFYWLAVWIGFAAAAAFVASVKGRSAIGHFLLTLVAPPIGIFVVWALPPRTLETIDERLRLLSNTAADLQRRLPK